MTQILHDYERLERIAHARGAQLHAERRKNSRMFLLLAFLTGALLGVIAAAAISEARADAPNDLYRMRVALESIAESVKGCRR